MSTPYMSGHQPQVSEVLAMSRARRSVPKIGRFASTAARGMPRIMWRPNFTPAAWQASATGAKPRGKKQGAGTQRP